MKTIQMTIDESLLQQVDETVELLQTTRSAFIRWPGTSCGNYKNGMKRGIGPFRLTPVKQMIGLMSKIGGACGTRRSEMVYL